MSIHNFLQICRDFRKSLSRLLGKVFVVQTACNGYQHHFTVMLIISREIFQPESLVSDG